MHGSSRVQDVLAHMCFEAPEIDDITRTMRDPTSRTDWFPHRTILGVTAGVSDKQAVAAVGFSWFPRFHTVPDRFQSPGPWTAVLMWR